MGWARLASRCIGIGLIVLATVGANAHGADLRLSSLEVIGDEVAPAIVLDGTFDAQFHERPDGRVHLAGGADRTYWLRIAFTLPEGAGGEEGPVLVFDRVALDRITVHLPAGEGVRHVVDDGFFRPDPYSSLGPNNYAFALPQRGAGPQVVYAAVQSSARLTLTPRVLDARVFHAQDRTAAGVLSAIYSAIVVLMLSALAMFVALRDRIYLHFVGFTLSLLLMLALGNGHLYHLPRLAWLGWWGANGLFAAALLCAAMAVGFTRHFLAAGLSDATVRHSTLLRYALFAVAGVCLLNLGGLVSSLQTLTGVLGALTAVYILLMSLHAWRQGEALARVYTGVWLLLGAAIIARVVLAYGWLPQTALTLYVFQVTAAVCTLLMSIGLADRVMEFRRQRDRAHQLKRETDASLQLEQVRRQFADSLREQIRSTTPEGDMEWLAFKRLLDSLRQVMPQLSSAVVAHGYHGRDLLMTEPLESKETFQRLLATRSGSLKSLCRSRKPVQLQLDESAQALENESGDEAAPIGGLFAVIPMPVAAPGWGALLIERSVFEPFSADDLKLAAEFLAQAVSATDAASQQADLQRKAEIDPLTGAANRRAGDEMIESALQRAISDRQPFSLVVVALDGLKQINERHGHAMGDEFLRRSADAARREMARDDVLVRRSGEEFMIALPGRPPDQARQLAERLLRNAAQLRPEPGGQPVRCTLSIGIAGRQPNDDDVTGIVERAERALENAKRHGRNQVQVAQSYGFGVASDDAPSL
jgi:diguanylate cyclase (GGDEF)-like protein